MRRQSPKPKDYPSDDKTYQYGMAIINECRIIGEDIIWRIGEMGFTIDLQGYSGENRVEQAKKKMEAYIQEFSDLPQDYTEIASMRAETEQEKIYRLALEQLEYELTRRHIERCNARMLIQNALNFAELLVKSEYK